MFRKRLVSFVLCFVLVMACLPVFSLSASADNEGFCQVRIFYKIKDSSGNWGAEQSAIITDNSFLPVPINGSQDVQITRFLVRNDSESLCYFQFDINFGALIPNSGTWPVVRNSSLAFTTNGGVTAYSFDATDKSHVMVPYQFQNNIMYEEVYLSAQRTFFGKCSSSGYITFNSPVILTYSPAPAYSVYLYIYFRHLVIGTDNSSYLSNIEHYLSDIGEYTNNINEILQKHDDYSQEFLDAGGAGAISDAAAFAPSAFGFIGALFGARTIISLSPGSYSYTNRFWTEWAHNIMNPNLVTRNNDDGYIDFYQQNIDEFWGGDE